jgi:uncharacterized protein YggE
MNIRLVLALFLAAASANADPFPTEPHVYVEGSAEIRVEPDTLELSIVIEATDAQLAVAKSKVDERAQKLIAACKQLGIADADLTSASLEIGPAYDYSDQQRKLIGTKVGRPIEVKLRDLAKYAELIQATVAAKVDQIESTVMSSSKGKQLIEDAQKAALADARARAERFAAASGQKLGSAYSISEFAHRMQERYLLQPARGFGSPERLHQYEADVSALGGGSYEPFEPGTIVATATVYVIYLLEAD